MKVFVVTTKKVDLFSPEEYVSVKANAKDAEKFIRGRFPNARKEEIGYGVSGFLCIDGGNKSYMYIHEEEI